MKLFRVEVAFGRNRTGYIEVTAQDGHSAMNQVEEMSAVALLQQLKVKDIASVCSAWWSAERSQ
jgi:hypothetical protein